MRSRGTSLPAKEQQVALLVAKRYTTGEIVSELGVGLGTAGHDVSAVLTFMQRRSTQEAGGAPGFSAREVQVAALVEAGMSDREIAERLGISQRTDEDHVHNILTRLGLSGRAEVRLGE
jgi:DNA-binding CsgD family transcriptional regulator